MNKDILELAEMHKGKEYSKALLKLSSVYEYNCTTEYIDNKLKAFLCYFTLPYVYDMICVTDKDNIYSYSLWKELSKYLKNRTREIRINSTPTEKDRRVIDKAIIKYNGYREGNTLFFPID